ncbi:MAG: hypothetical protein ABIV51_06555 [Saprospiraceae bacterium]
MKKILGFIFFFSMISSANAQSNYVDSLRTALSKTTQLLDRFNLLERLGEETFTHGSGDMSVSNNLEMLRIARQLKNDTLIGLAYSYTGIFYLYTKGDFNTALDYYFKGLPFAERARQMHTVSGINVDISNAFSFLKNTEQQLYFAKAAEATLPDKKDPTYSFMLTQVQLCYALYYINIKDPKSALRHIQSAKEANLKANATTMEVFIETIFGLTYFQLDDTELAEVYFKKAIANSNAIQMPFLRYFTKDGFIKFLLGNKNYVEAGKQASDMNQLGESSHNNFIKLNATSYLKTVFDLQNRLDSAYFYSKQELALKDSVFSQEKVNRAQAMAFNEDLRLKEEQNKKMAEEDQRQQNIQFALIALGIIVFIILFLLLSRSFITSTKLIEFFGVMALLVVFEFLNLLLHPFLERVTHHKPVLMLLALVSIAAILIPLHHRLEKWTTKMLLEKNKAIRLAVAKKTIERLEG